MTNLSLISILLYVLVLLGFAAHFRHLSMIAGDGIWRDIALGAYASFVLSAMFYAFAAAPHVWRNL